MNTKLTDRSFVAGVPTEIKPISNLPIGAVVSFKFSNDSFGFAFVRTPGEWAAYDLNIAADGSWELGHKLKWEKLPIPALCPGCGNCLPANGDCKLISCDFPAIPQ